MVTAPEDEAEMGPSFAVAWDASFSRVALSFLASPAFFKRVSIYLVTMVHGGVEMTYHIRGIAKDRSDCTLNSARSLVNVGFRGGGVVVRHDCGLVELVW